MRKEQVRILADCEIAKQPLAAGSLVHLSESLADTLVQSGKGAFVHEVELLKEVPVGTAIRGVGSVVAVSSRVAMEWHRTGVAKLLDPNALGNPPAPKAELRPEPTPFPADPRIVVKVGKKGLLHRTRFHAAGDQVELPERIAVKVIHQGLATIVKGQELSVVGKRYQAELAKISSYEPAYA